MFFRHTGIVFENLNFEMGLEDGKIAVVAQGETSAGTAVDPAPSRYALKRFSQGHGSIKKGGTQLAGVTAGNLTFSNTLERVRTIRPDGRIDAGDPISVEYGFSTAEGYVLKFELFRVFLPQPKRSITGPGGVPAQYDWRAAYNDEAEGTMLRVTLLNDVAGYA